MYNELIPVNPAFYAARPQDTRGRRRTEAAQESFADILKRLEQQLDVAYNNLNNQTNEILIDSCIYEINALNKKHEYYLGMYKARAASEGI